MCFSIRVLFLLQCSLVFLNISFDRKINVMKHDLAVLKALGETSCSPSPSLVQILTENGILYESIQSKTTLSQKHFKSRSKRGGKSRRRRNQAILCHLLLWNIEGFWGANNVSPDEDPFKSYDIIVLTETFITSDIPSIPNFYTFMSYAKKPERGRPMGGLLIGIKPHMNGKLIQSTYDYIIVSTTAGYIVGLYLKPQTPIDEICAITADILNMIPEDVNVIFCGDYNVRIDIESDRKDHLIEFYHALGFEILNDRDIPTYTTPNGKSCIDLVFSNNWRRKKIS